MRRALLFLSLVSALLLAACQPPAADAPATPPTSHLPLPTFSPLPTSNLSLPTSTSTPTEAPLTLAELGIPTGQEDFFSGVEGHIKREVIDGEKVYTTTILYHNGEKKEVKYIIEPGTFDVHTEIYDDLTRPLAVKAYWLDENGKKTEVILFWQGPERGFREAIDLSGAYDPELTQVDQHPYVHIVHGYRPIRSIKDLPKDDERLTLLQSVRLEQAKAIRALQDIRQKLQNGEKITAEDLQGSVFLRRLQEKLQAGEPITKDDLYVFFSPKAVENWEKAGGLMLRFEFENDGSKWVYLISRSFTMNFYPLWFYTKDKNGNIYHKMMIIILDADDVARYNNSDPKDPTLLQGKWLIGENKNDVEVSPKNIAYLQDLYRQNNPDFPFIILYAEGGDLEKIKTEQGRQELIARMRQEGKDEETIKTILDELARLNHLLSLPDNDPGKLPYLALPDENGKYPFELQDLYPEGFGLAKTHPQGIGERYVGQAIFENDKFTGLYDWAPLPSTFQLLELKFGVAVRISN